jgi:hypothetical protein
VDALAPGQHQKGDQAEIGQQRPQPYGRLLHFTEIQPLVGIEVENEPVGIFQLADPAAPPVELDRPHLNTGEDSTRILNVDIVPNLAVAFLDGDVLDVGSHRAAVMLLEKTVGGQSLRAADHADRPLCGVDQHQFLDDGVIVGEIALGQIFCRIDDAIRAADPDAETFGGRRVAAFHWLFGAWLAKQPSERPSMINPAIGSVLIPTARRRHQQAIEQKLKQANAVDPARAIGLEPEG